MQRGLCIRFLFADIEDYNSGDGCGANAVRDEKKGGVDCKCKDGYEVPDGTVFPADCKGKHSVCYHFITCTFTYDHIHTYWKICLLE